MTKTHIVHEAPREHDRLASARKRRGRVKNVPMLAFTAAGCCGSVESPTMTTPLPPIASTVRMIEPRLPGFPTSWRPTKTAPGSRYERRNRRALAFDRCSRDPKGDRARRCSRTPPDPARPPRSRPSSPIPRPPRALARQEIGRHEKDLDGCVMLDGSAHVRDAFDQERAVELPVLAMAELPQTPDERVRGARDHLAFHQGPSGARSR